MLRKIALLLVLFMGSAFISSAQNFGGIIEFKKQTGASVVNYVYYVKGDKVRIDEFTAGTRTISGSFIVNTTTGTMLFMDPDRKLWGTRAQKGSAAAPAGCVATSAKTTKEMFGYKCTEQVVRNNSDSTEITYYIAPGKFAFFVPMMRIINRQEKMATYFFAMTLKDGSMPLLSIEKDLKGAEKGRLEVTRLEEKDLAETMFSVPKDYTEVK
jgi:hypothetical protein